MSIKHKPQEKHKMSEIDDQILKHFEIKKRLGKGAYGIVWKATDKKTTQIVAVKKIFDAFRNETDAQRTFREIMFLRAFRNHPNVIQLHSIYRAANNLDMYLSFEYMESDLHNVIKRGSILKDVHKRYVMYQLLNAIKYIHSGNVIHRDLKPSNVLIDSKCRCKIADFGLARSVSHRQIGETKAVIDPSEQILTDYVATRWYRAPEILVASKRYTKGIDMWSLGCILGEMIRGKPLFPGSSTINQVERIISALPEATEMEVAAVGSGFGSVLLNQQINSNSNPKLDELLSGSTEDAKSLVKSLLVLDPAARLTAKQALTHKYVEKFRHTIPEAELHSDILPPFRDDVQLTVSEYRTKLYELMQSSSDNKSSVANSAKQQQRRKSATPSQLENALTVTSSGNFKKPLSCAPKIYEKLSTANAITQMDNQHFKTLERKTYVLPQSNGSNNLATSISKSRMTPNIVESNLPNRNTTANLKPVPKVKYCKVTSFPESKPSVTTSERVDLYKAASPFSKLLNTTGVEKRHSIDCTYTSDHHHPVTYQTPPSRCSNLYSSYTNLNNYKAYRNSKTASEDDTGYSSFSNKYSNGGSKYSVRPALDTPKDRHKSYAYSDKGAPPIKITRADFLNMSTESGSYYERRLKTLEDKIQRHKNDIKALFAQNSKYKGTKSCDGLAINDKRNSLNLLDKKFSRIRTNLTRSKSENEKSFASRSSAAVKFDYTRPEGERISAKRRGSSFGVTTAEELYEIRNSQII